MIRSFNNKETRHFFEGKQDARFHGFSVQVTRRLTVLDSAAELHDLAMLRSNRLEALRGSRAGQFGVRINSHWRICFRWADDGPHEAEIVDYH